MNTKNSKIYIATLLTTIILLPLVFSCIQKSDLEKDVCLLQRKEVLIPGIRTSSITLLTANESIIGTIGQIESSESSIFILDVANNNQKVMVFDKNGSFVSNVGSLGQGDGQYIQPLSFSINPRDTNIGIIDNQLKKVFLYNTKDYTYTNSIKLPLSALCYEYHSDSHIAWCCAESNDKEENYGYATIITDSMNVVKNRLIEKRNKSGYMTGPAKGIYKTPRGLSFFCQFDPNIYDINSDSASVRLTVAFEGFEFPPLDFIEKKNRGGGFFSELEDSDFISSHYVNETKNGICILFFVKGEKYIGLINKLNGDAVYYTMGRFEALVGVKGLTFVAGTIDDYFAIPLMEDSSNTDSQLKDRKTGELVPITKDETRLFLFAI